MSIVYLKTIAIKVNKAIQLMSHTSLDPTHSIRTRTTSVKARNNDTQKQPNIPLDILITHTNTLQDIEETQSNAANKRTLNDSDDFTIKKTQINQERKCMRVNPP